MAMTEKKPRKPDQSSLRVVSIADSLMKDRLSISGLDINDANLLGITAVSSAAALDPSFKSVPAMRLPYFHPTTGRPLSGWPSWPPFYRIRYLTDSRSELERQGGVKLPRYAQPPESGVCAYFPKTIEWKQIFGDPDRVIVITEGELKAAAGAKIGLATIGLGGVWSWRSINDRTRMGIRFLDELSEVPWTKREVILLFDSDVKTNDKVASALWALAEELRDRGAMPSLAFLPELTGLDKVGLDDFLVHRSGGKEQLFSLLDRASPLGLARPLWDLNEEVVYAKSPGIIVVRDTAQRISPAAFVAHSHSTESVIEPVLTKGGAIVYKPAVASAVWMRWPGRSEVDRIDYRPGKPLIVDGCYNMWKGWGVEPSPGNIKPFELLMKNLLRGLDEEHARWIWQWLAYPLQHPGTKMYTSLVLQSRDHGTGKTFLAEIMGRIYGENYYEISEDDLHKDFNSWAHGRQFILIDDISGSTMDERRSNYRALKKITTQERVKVNEKHVPEFYLTDTMNFMITTNHTDALAMEDDDRRFFVHSIPDGKLDLDFYNSLRSWKFGDGPSFLFHHLLNKVSLEGFDPRGRAPMTKGKEMMMAHSQSDLGAWVHSLMIAPDEMLTVGGAKGDRDIYSARELTLLYDPLGHRRTSTVSVAREIMRTGAVAVADAAIIAGPDGVTRYYAVRNIKKWRSADVHEVQRHFSRYLADVAPPITKPKYK